MQVNVFEGVFHMILGLKKICKLHSSDPVKHDDVSQKRIVDDMFLRESSDDECFA